MAPSKDAVTEPDTEMRQIEKEEKRDILAEVGGPDKATIEQWKAEHGDVFMFAASDTEVFIFRPISRSEWLEAKQKVSEMEFKNQAELDDVSERIVADIAILWKSDDAANSMENKAGTVGIINEQVMLRSYFIAASAVEKFVTKL